MKRREFLKAVAGGALLPAASLTGPGEPDDGPADFTLHIGPAEVEIAPRRRIKTTAYNGMFPGPVLRMAENKPVVIDVYNDSDIPELAHWHGLFIPPEVDGAAEEGTPMVAPHTRQRYRFVPRPAGTRWYHSHISAGDNLHRATYTGQYGFLIIERGGNPGRYDQEVLLALHGWEPFLTYMKMNGLGKRDDSSLEVGYNRFTVNSHALGAGEPIRVKQGERLLMRLLNANATDYHRLALPGHHFTVIALDGNPVPSPRAVSVLEMGPAERIDATVEMNQPGVWILGDIDDRARKLGLGIVVEYAGQSGAPQWQAPPTETWDYTVFGRGDRAEVAEPDGRVPLVFQSKTAINRWVGHWVINGKEFPKTDPIVVESGRKYRLIFDNHSDDTHPVHLHRHSFELVKVAGRPTAGILKDVVSVPARKQVEVQFVADNPGPSLFHCHMQLHMDFGFMALLEYADHPASQATSVHRP
jgi:FtsP/CotA-like multicopper oxidase with cupredoxin domain